MNSQQTTPETLTLEMGFQQLRSGNLDQALEIANQLLATHPNLHGAFNLAGLIAQQQGNLEQAITLLQQATALEPSERIYHSNLGTCYRQMHRYPEAIQSCQNALKLSPDYTNALITLGGTYFAAEQYQDAQVVYKQLIDLQPNEALFQAYWADALRESGQIQAAISAYEQALTLSPNLTYAIGNLGLTLLSVGEHEKALTYCRQATQQDPDSSANWINLGTVYRILDDLEGAMEAYSHAYDLNTSQQTPSAMLCTLIGQVWQEVGNSQQAMLWFDQALGIEPDRIETQCALGTVLLERGEIETAIAQFQHLISEYPHYYPAYLGLSEALWEDGNTEEAIAMAGKAAELAPEDARIKSHLGTILASAGDIEASNHANREALAVNPNCVAALYNLSQNLRGQLPQTDIESMEHLLTTPWISTGAKASLHFGLASYYDGCKNYAQAAHHSIQANQDFLSHKTTRGWNYNPDDYKQYLDRTIENFTPNFFQLTQGAGNPSLAPVFIVGMPRSGTTLTEQILASHPQIFGVGERPFANRSFSRLPLIMKQHQGKMVWEVFEEITPSHIRQRADWHLAQLEHLATKAGLAPEQGQYKVDKMPDNYNLLGWIVTIFPNAKIIHCRRDVRDVAVSCWMNQFKSVRWAFDWVHIAERVKQYWRIMDYWRQVLPVPILEIDYEDTIADQEQQTARLLDFLGLNWDDACLDFHKTDRLVRTASVTQVRQPIYTRSLERWRNYEEMLQPFLERLESQE